MDGFGLDPLLPGGLAGFHDGSEMSLDTGLELDRLMLREDGAWCRLEVEGVFAVHVGWDQYVYVSGDRPCPGAVERTRELGVPVRLRTRQGRLRPAAGRRRLVGRSGRRGGPVRDARWRAEPSLDDPPA
ncbi:hypothetical protein [Streptomyces sp. NPDC048659]|uniref:hypothetical protein n=1 Tax=Streptomyces sp. NPDC048659 TaxID=3155489 RepID=UPI0034219F02